MDRRKRGPASLRRLLGRRPRRRGVRRPFRGETAPPRGARSGPRTKASRRPRRGLLPRSRRVGNPPRAPPSPRRAGPRGRADCRGRVHEPWRRGVREKRPTRTSAPRLVGSRSRAPLSAVNPAGGVSNGQDLEQRGIPAARWRVAPDRPSAPGRWAVPAAAGGRAPHRRLRGPRPIEVNPMATPFDLRQCRPTHARPPAFYGARRVGGLAGDRKRTPPGIQKGLCGADRPPAKVRLVGGRIVGVGGRPVVDLERHAAKKQTGRQASRPPARFRKLRRQDLNLRPPGYEPGELPLLHAAPSESRLDLSLLLGMSKRLHMVILPRPLGRSRPIDEKTAPCRAPPPPRMTFALRDRGTAMTTAAAQPKQEWSPRLWHGATCSPGCVCSSATTLAVQPPYWHIAAVASAASVMNSTLRLLSGRLLRRPRRSHADPPGAAVHRRPLAHRHHAAARAAHPRPAAHLPQLLPVFVAASFPPHRTDLPAPVLVPDAVAPADGQHGGRLATSRRKTSSPWPSSASRRPT